MQVRVLGTYGYRGQLDQEWGESTPAPSWSDIEAAIRRLDAGEFAGVVLHQFDYCDGPARASFAVTGGPSGYLVTCTGTDGCELAIVNPAAPDGGQLVGVCQRDQGVWMPERMVCRDFEQVLAAARHYVGTGRPWPAVKWE